MNTAQTTTKQAKSTPAKKMPIQHLLNDLVDGSALTYWADAEKIKRDRDGQVISFVVFDGAREGKALSSEKKTINKTSLMKARQKLLLDDVDVHRDVAAQFVGPADRWSYDDDGMDALVQVALFGKLVYG
jgi:hypothetical protein